MSSASGHFLADRSVEIFPFAVYWWKLEMTQETWHRSHVPSIHAFIEVPQADVIEEVIPCCKLHFGETKKCRYLRAGGRPMPLGWVFQPSMGFNDLDCHVNKPCESCRSHTMKSISSTSFSIQKTAATPDFKNQAGKTFGKAKSLSLHHHPRNIFVKLAFLPRGPLL